jgi:hypothetical protein
MLRGGRWEAAVPRRQRPGWRRGRRDETSLTRQGQGLPAPRPRAGREAKKAARPSDHEEPGPPRLLRQGQEVKKLGEQAQRAVPRLRRPRRGGTMVDAAPCTVAGGARMPMSQQRPLGGEEGEEGLTTAARFYSLAASAPYRRGPRLLHDLLSKICDTTSAGPVALSLAITYEEVRPCRVTFTLPHRTITR